MNGEIAQRVAIVCHGNAFLAGRDLPDLIATNTTCQFCASVTFKGAEADLPNPNAWFGALRDEGVYGLLLNQAPRNDPRTPDRMMAGFTGGGSAWAVEAVKRDGSSDFYAGRWELGDRNSPERRIWLVTYSKVATLETRPVNIRPLSTMTPVLTGALMQIEKYASSHRYCEQFAPVFEKALEGLRGTPVGYHRDLAPVDTLSPEAENLLNACQAAWVFGGMGSWNDIGFEDAAEQAEYEAVSSYLYNALVEAIPAAANDSFRVLA
jgi:hypothetical protein